MTTRVTLVLTTARVASLYQDKEERKKVNTNEEEVYKDSLLELLDIYDR